MSFPGSGLGGPFGSGGVLNIRFKTSSPFFPSVFLSVSDMANPIETDFKLALALGRLAGRWGQAEFAVEMIYITLSEMPNRKATISYSFHKSVATQKDIICLLADETTWITDAERATVNSVVKKFADMSAQRNGWIHYPFGVDSSSPNMEVYKGKRMRKGDILYSKEPANHQLITAFANDVTDLTKNLFDAHHLLMSAYARKSTQPLLDRIQSELTATPQKPLGLRQALERLQKPSGQK